MKRAITLFLLFIMVSAQLALAQHATVHFVQDEHIQYAAADTANSYHKSAPLHGHEEANEFCQLCFVSKHFFHLNLAGVAAFDISTRAVQISFANADSAARAASQFAFEARGPPARS